MDTPVYDFVSGYCRADGVRAHMPGHKGRSFLGIEQFDITEIRGADALYEADGIIAESERNASSLFGTSATFYSTEGSSQCIKAMVAMAYRSKKTDGNVILATRNAHKSFIYACALLDIEIVWLGDEKTGFSLCRCNVSSEKLSDDIEKYSPFAVYVTSPDYLGGMLDIKALAEVSHSAGVPLLVDNAHGAYLHFLEEKLHPMDLGADMCCDSAHKTLPVLTGGAYLHVSKNAEKCEEYVRSGKRTMEMFGSTSPSYLILQSLDLCNRYISDGYKEKLESFIEKLDVLKDKLKEKKYTVEKSDLLKLTISSTGKNISEILGKYGIECEYEDPDFTVLMFTPENSDDDLTAVYDAMPVNDTESTAETMRADVHIRKMSVRKAVFADSESVKVEIAAGRVAAAPTVSCPPAIPIVISGEIINESDIALFEHYNIDRVEVVKE